MSTGQGCFKRAFPWGKGVVVLSVGAMTAWSGGCRGKLDSIDVILRRHEKAVAKLPEETRERLMPYGAPVATEESHEILPSGALPLDAARAVAIRANPDIHAAQARLEAARAAIELARSRFFPTIFFSHNSTRTFHTPASRNRLATLLQPQPTVPTDIESTSFVATALLNAIRLPLFGGNNPGGITNSFSEHSTAFAVSWTLFDGFVREANLLATKQIHQASWALLQDVERLVVQAVDRAYFQVQLGKERIRIAKADEKFSRDQLDETEKLRAAGRATLADVNNFRVRMLAAQANVTASEGLRDTGLVVLAELMGLTDARAPHDLKMPPLADETEYEMTTPNPEPWIKRALANRPDLHSLVHRLEADEESVRAAQGLFMPTVALSGSWGFDRSSNLNYDVDDQSSAMVMEFRWELFTGGARRAQVREAESRRAETAANLNRRRLAIQSEVRQSIIKLRDAQEQIRLQRENVTVAMENRRIVRAGYLAGKETLVRLNEAQRDFFTADADLALSRIQLRQAWSDLHAAAGTYRETVNNGDAAPAEEEQPVAKETEE
ncbi:MAG: TolC family protein [Planctomycetes bacterium]|nr:TolC family protein [Planctomycetota bacterium]